MNYLKEITALLKCTLSSPRYDLKSNRQAIKEYTKAVIWALEHEQDPQWIEVQERFGKRRHKKFT